MTEHDIDRPHRQATDGTPRACHTSPPAGEPPAPAKTYGHSDADGAYYVGEFSSREEALAEAWDYYGSDVVYTAVAVPWTLCDLLCEADPEASVIKLEDSIYDATGCEDPLPDRGVLEADINAAIAKWALSRLRKLPYRVEDVQEHTR